MEDAPARLPDLEATAEFLLRLRARGIGDLAVLRALEAVPREVFVPPRYAALAGKDVALPLPCGQTMAEPYIVARMVEGLVLTPACRVLEIGSGSGYVTAVLARLGREVLGVERFRSLARQAATRLSALGIGNARVVWGDGLAVPSSEGPFDRLLVHAALDGVPAECAALLAPDGVMVFAQGRGGAAQRLVAARRGPDGGWTTADLAPARARPLYDGPSQTL